MVVRDDDCNILNPEASSTIQLFWQHQKATEDIKKARVKITQILHCSYVKIKNFEETKFFFRMKLTEDQNLQCQAISILIYCSFAFGILFVK